jgi:hypothetical protein
MKNIAPGLSLKKYKGNKHEQGGIMVNALGNKTKDINKAVAEVEGGEYNYRYDPTNPNNNYILSAQLVEPAKIAKQADTFKNNDRISYNTRTNLLNKSVKLNEVLKGNYVHFKLNSNRPNTETALNHLIYTRPMKEMRMR